MGTETLLKFSCIETVTEREAAGVCLQGNCEKMVLRFSSGATSVTRSSRSHIRIRVSEFYTHRYVYIDTYTYIHTRVVDRCVGVEYSGLYRIYIFVLPYLPMWIIQWGCAMLNPKRLLYYTINKRRSQSVWRNAPRTSVSVLPFPGNRAASSYIFTKNPKFAGRIF